MFNVNMYMVTLGNSFITYFFFAVLAIIWVLPINDNFLISHKHLKPSITLADLKSGRRTNILHTKMQQMPFLAASKIAI